MLVHSRQYPELRVSTVGVKFRGGVAEVADGAALEHLRSLTHLGIEVPAAEKRKPGRPKKSE